MLLEFVQGLGDYLKTQVTELKGCERYKGELDNQGAKWNVPKFPYCFIDFVSDVPSEYTPAGESLDNAIGVNLIVADKDVTQPSTLIIYEKIRDAVDGKTITIIIEEENVPFHLTIRKEGGRKLGYFKGVEHYNIPIEVNL